MVQTVTRLKPFPKVLLAFIAATLLMSAGIFAWWTISPLFIDVTVSEGLELTPESRVLLSGAFGGISRYRVSGLAQVIEGGGERVLRFEEGFSSTNGPDLFVWLVRGGDVNDYVDLGRLKGNLGSQNYTIPEGVDLAQYDQVLIWCRAFRVLFGSATLEGGTT
jgi:hypothetical protein